MRLYENLDEALSEIQRDLYKGPKVTSTRVQQQIGKELPGRELMGYSYLIEAGGIPEQISDLISLGLKFNFKSFEDPGIDKWLRAEKHFRSSGVIGEHMDSGHPALSQTIEGNWPSYTYGERLSGAKKAVIASLSASPDSRRAYWPIFEQHDSKRAAAPTRVPCSLGYQVMIRNTQDGPQLNLIYLQRSADFDAFFLSDIWFANQFQKEVAKELGYPSGQFIHFISSLHSFTVEGTEIY